MVHRIDGPICVARGQDDGIDRAIIEANHLFADGTVFQSRWSREQNIGLGLSPTDLEIVLFNAPNPTIYFPPDRASSERAGKIRLIASSWSDNWRKGFADYQYLDETLDFSRYEMTFVGNSPVSFHNIKVMRPMNRNELANCLRSHDIFISASRSEACSNSILEAMHCGLPVLGFNDSSNPELIASGGLLYRSNNEMTVALQELSINLARFRAAICLPSIYEVAHRYYQFCCDVAEYRGSARIGRGRNGSWRMYSAIINWKVRSQVAHYFEKLTSGRSKLKCY